MTIVSLLDLGIDLLRHEAIILDSEGDGIKPGTLPGVIPQVSGVYAREGGWNVARFGSDVFQVR
jgi:hypothetical protein